MCLCAGVIVEIHIVIKNSKKLYSSYILFKVLIKNNDCICYGIIKKYYWWVYKTFNEYWGTLDIVYSEVIF